MSAWDDAGYDAGWGSAVYAPDDTGSAPSGGGYDAGEGGYDPFAYTRGSLLTPWEGHFDSSRFGTGGPGVADYKAFEFGDFAYKPALPDSFNERYNDPGEFKYGDFTAPPEFKPPTEADMQADPGYQARLNKGMKVLQASRAAQGLLRTGGTAKGLVRFGQNEASEEYDKVYGRRLGENQLAYGRAKDVYGINRANAAENFDRNVSNARQAHQIRQGDWRGNADVTLEGSRLGYDVAQGTYDRNLSLHRQQYEDERAHANAVAAASAAGANQAYNRALDDYTRSRDEFWTNQDRQYAILDREATRGYGAARDYAGMQSGIYMDRGDAQASGRVGSANAWNGALGNIGSYAADAAFYAARRPTTTSTTTRR